MESRRINPNTVRRWTSVWLLFQVVAAVALWRAPAKRGMLSGDQQTIAALLLLLAVTGLVLLWRTKRHRGPGSWRAATWFFGLTGALMAVGYVAGLVMGVEGSVAKALIGVSSQGVIQLMVWGKLREALGQKIWESDHKPVAPVFD